MNIALTQIAVLANMEADYAQRNFKKHIDGALTFLNGTTTTLQYTDYSGSTYLYEFNGRVLRYKKDSGDRGILLENIVGVDADTLGNRSKFVYKDKYYADLDEPIDESKIRGVNLIFYILRGESVYSYSTYAAVDKYQLDIWD